MMKSDPLGRAVEIEVEVRLAQAARIRLAHQALKARSGNPAVEAGGSVWLGWLRRLSSRLGAITDPIA